MSTSQGDFTPLGDSESKYLFSNQKVQHVQSHLFLKNISLCTK